VRRHRGWYEPDGSSVPPRAPGRVRRRGASWRRRPKPRLSPVRRRPRLPREAGRRAATRGGSVVRPMSRLRLQGDLAGAGATSEHAKSGWRARTARHPRERVGRARAGATPSGRVDRSSSFGVVPETWRTPWSAAGRNKPASRRAEQAVEVGQNDKDGTTTSPGRRVAKAELRSRREWTRDGHVDGGAILDNPMRDARAGGADDPAPRRRARSDGRDHRLPHPSSCVNLECLRRRSQGQGRRACRETRMPVTPGWNPTGRC
jgi:hypothetical protein